MKPLEPLRKKIHTGQVLLVIMDGMGLSPNREGNAFAQARTPVLDLLMKTRPNTRLRAHGAAVGLPSDDDMGNSEVGHNALGAGRIFDQGAKLVNKALASGSIFGTPVWKKLTDGPREGSAALHFIGLLSDGNVHSHIDQLFLLLEKAAEEKVKKARLHILLDGRDVPETSALIYMDRLEERLAGLNGRGLDYRIASGGGRMVTTMDRYEADWEVVRAGWQAHVLGKARPFGTAREAIETFRKEERGITDQYLPSFTIADARGPVGPVTDGDSVLFFNFRGDRAIEISRAFEEKDFTMFDRERRPDVFYAGMMEYDGDLKIPANYLVSPPEIEHTVSEYLVRAGCRQYALSETQKFGHVTYFWNGNRSGMFDKKLEVYEEIPSDRVRFDERPWMKAAEITDSAIAALAGEKFDFLRLNYPNGDMVGHTGNFEAAVIAAETVDLCLGRLLETADRYGACALITADHGNLDEMYQLDKNGAVQRDAAGEPVRKTSHTLNPVPFIFYHPSSKGGYGLRPFDTPPGLANVAATVLNFLGYEAPADYLPSLIRVD
ncbi:MAG TPA: 2,3-bisphosphoglycerate-independent phosphoglycerate mutase [Spirochaetes bacterium]|nr:2,3-bisphosphoglycerate-independent phosphoglycerate mutase [Spirochaetota bacterium]